MNCHHMLLFRYHAQFNREFVKQRARLENDNYDGLQKDFGKFMWVFYDNVLYGVFFFPANDMKVHVLFIGDMPTQVTWLHKLP